MDVTKLETQTFGKLLFDYKHLLRLETKEMEVFDEDTGHYVVCIAVVHRSYQVFGSAHNTIRSLAFHDACREAQKELIVTFREMDGGMVDKNGDLEIEMKKRVNAELEHLKEVFTNEEDFTYFT